MTEECQPDQIRAMTLPVILPDMLSAGYEYDDEEDERAYLAAIGEDEANGATPSSSSTKPRARARMALFDSVDDTRLPTALGCPFQRKWRTRSPQYVTRREEAGRRVLRMAELCRERLRRDRELLGARDSSRGTKSKSLPSGTKFNINDLLKGRGPCAVDGARTWDARLGASEEASKSCREIDPGSPGIFDTAPAGAWRRQQSDEGVETELMESQDMEKTPKSQRRSRSKEYPKADTLGGVVSGQALLEALSKARPEAAPLEGTIIIFDWDDTLFPTWFVMEVVLPCLPDIAREGPLPPDSPFSEVLNAHASTLKALLCAAKAIGQVGIVTLSKRPWVPSSAARFFPELNIEQMLQDLSIPVIYARECVHRPMVSAAQVEEGIDVLTIVKRAGMAKALKKLYGPRAAWKNVISIGDSIIERDAVKEVIWTHEHGPDNKAPRCKTVKLMEEPSAEQLGAQLLLVSMWLRSMAAHEEDFDIVMDDSDETMFKMHEQFTT